jgi:hypothetical protein
MRRGGWGVDAAAVLSFVCLVAGVVCFVWSLGGPR